MAHHTVTGIRPFDLPNVPEDAHRPVHRVTIQVPKELGVMDGDALVITFQQVPLQLPRHALGSDFTVKHVHQPTVHIAVVVRRVTLQHVFEDHHPTHIARVPVACGTVMGSSFIRSVGMGAPSTTQA